MLRFIVKEVYVGHVVFAQGQPETRIVSFEDTKELENFLRYRDKNGKQPNYLTREIIGVELL